MKPYLEVKVVKVKKEKEEKINCNAEFICPICNEILHHKDKVKKKGNWVNGENLDKIKFPCFCRWDDDNYGMIIKHYWNKEDVYILVGIDEQTQKNHTFAQNNILRDIISAYDVHILKGKIILFEEE